MLSKLPTIFILAAVLIGCKAAPVGKTLAADVSGSDPDAQLNYWHSLADQPITSNDEAFHGILLYLDTKDDSADYAARVNAMKSRGLLDKNFNEPAEFAVKRGTVAVAMVKILQVKGGLTMHVFGASPRYATRELQFMNLYPPGATWQTFSGNEFLGIIGRMEDYQRGDPANRPASQL